MATESAPPPRPIRHSHALPDGRLLAYYTFATGADEASLRSHHPVLYLHGFPGSGVEGSLTARAAARAGCRLYAVDRPGFGRSTPNPNEGDWEHPDEYIQSFVVDAWDFVRARGWKSFSIVGVSGGGPYALALLESFLRSKFGGGGAEDPIVPSSCNLVAVSTVAGVFCTAGSEGMMPSNEGLVSIASLEGWKSTLARYGLPLIVGIQRFLLLWIFLPLLPEKWMMRIMAAAMKDVPEVDKNALLDDEAIARAFLNVITEALRQGTRPAVLEAKVLFQSKGYHFEQSLSDNWAKVHATPMDDGSVRTGIPRVTLFQGHLDVNVPLSHSRYVHEHIFGGTAAILKEYNDEGHLSLIVNHADAVMQSVAC